ncbi:PAS domain S-box protein [Ktedonospora formicarum]|uniref:histidine kinase n=1 Tax=Ktedonospora formicarum TaxID=2778364 RepID=A0A8J3I0K9_9CHLR|nr:PAS domain S-box protein [Ktedonospora formicarum]GHO47762.1 hypothetical protein KSX_59250 [Ktedonospora formicarum]
MKRFHARRTRQLTLAPSETLTTILDTLPDAVFLLDKNERITYVNAQARTFAGGTSATIAGKRFWQCVPQLVAPSLYQAVRNVEQAQTPIEIQYASSVTHSWFHVQVSPTAAGLVLRFREEKAHPQVSPELYAMIDTIPQLLWIGQPDGQISYCNQRWRDYTGLSMQQIQENEWLQYIHPDDQQRTLHRRQEALQAGLPYEIAIRLRHGATGEYRWFLSQAIPYKDARGKIIAYIGAYTDIDEQKRARQQLATSERNFRVLAETVPQLVWTTLPDGRLDYCNRRYCDCTQAPFEQLQGYGWRAFLHPDDRERIISRRQQTLDSGEPFESEHRLKDGQTGTYRWFLVRAIPIRDETDHVVKWFGTSTDIHDKKQAENELRALIEAIPQFVWTMYPNGACEYCNKTWCDYANMSLEQLQGDGWVNMLHPDEREHVLATWHTAYQTNMPYAIEHRIRNGKTGEYRWFLARSMPLRDSCGVIRRWIGTCTDIDVRKRAEQQLAASERNFRVLAETVPQLVWTMWPDGRLDYTNQRYRDVTQANLHLEGDDLWREFVHPDDIEHTLALRHQLLRTGEIYENEYRLKDARTGEYRWYLTRALPIRDEAGHVVKWFGTSTDIHDQKRIEEALRQSQERANALMNSTIIGIIISEGERIVDANDTFLRMTGYTREDLCNGDMYWRRMTPPEYQERTQQAHQELAARQYWTPYEKEYTCKDGSRLPVLIAGIRLQHHPQQIIAFVLDNSARQELEQRKDAFISMASHELKTPLTALKMQAQLVRRRLQRQEHTEAAALLSHVEGPIKQLERLINELLDVSKMQAGRLEYRREQVELEALLREVVETMQHITPTHTLVLHSSAPCVLLGDKDRLGQVFINLISNAIKYSPGVRTVEIDLSATHNTVSIRVQDHGLGIPQEQRDKIFDRFYRVTSANSTAIPGLGMGLYIVAEIIKYHGGTITVESEVGQGSTFQVTLPCSDTPLTSRKMKL